MKINPVLKSNPFGATSEEEVKGFEEKLGCVLPSAYRSYLLSHNGATFQRDVLGAQGVRINCMFGLHNGPDYARLSERWQIPDGNDDIAILRNLRNYIVFGTCGTGELLLLNLETGAVFLLEQDTTIYGQYHKYLPQGIDFVASNFDEFAERLLSNDQALDLLPESEKLDFERRLAEAKSRARLKFSSDSST